MSTKIEGFEFPKINSFGLKSHMNMEDCGIRIDAGEIDWPGNPINGKTFVREVYTPKTKGQWGKGEVTFYISGLEEKDPPTFKDPKSLVKYYEAMQHVHKA